MEYVPAVVLFACAGIAAVVALLLSRKPAPKKEWMRANAEPWERPQTRDEAMAFARQTNSPYIVKVSGAAMGMWVANQLYDAERAALWVAIDQDREELAKQRAKYLADGGYSSANGALLLAGGVGAASVAAAAGDDLAPIQAPSATVAPDDDFHDCGDICSFLEEKALGFGIHTPPGYVDDLDDCL